jgi:hypothetical protein
MSAWAAFRTGIVRVNGAPMVLAGLVLVTLLVALPLSLALSAMIEAHLGQSLVAEAVADGASYDWWQEFSAQASGLGTTFVPSIIGFGAVLHNLSGLADNVPMASTIAGVTAAWMVLWSFLSGGILDRLARGRPTRSQGFFAACGTHFWRFARLGLVALGVYAALFASVHPWLFSTIDGLTQDITVERTAFLINLGGYIVFGLLLAAASLVFDYSRIRIVVEDRRSALGALAAALRFLRRHPGSASALYLLNAAAFALVICLYAALAPGAPRSGLSVWLVVGLGQIYIVARHYLKLVFYGSQTALFQGALAHATYTAAPPVVWPESPAAEAIANADPAVR